MNPRIGSLCLVLLGLFGCAAPTGETTSSSAEALAAACGQLGSNEGLGVNQSVTSCDGRFTFVMQGDGNLVLYQNGAGPLWASGTRVPGTVLAMQGDGNLVEYGPHGGVRFATGTQGHPGATLAVQGDGNVVVYGPAGHPLWATNTAGH
jgi:streptogrisin C